MLLIFQAMDAAGKDGTIKHVMSGINPQGCQVFSFKAPSAEELDHDFLWRTSKCLPERGRIGIFNRSYYEEVLVVRVHPPILAGAAPAAGAGHEVDLGGAARGHRRLRALPRAQGLPDPQVLPPRLEGGAEGSASSSASTSRRRTGSSRSATSASARTGTTTWRPTRTAIRATAAPHAPWYVVPADHKWFTRLVVAQTVVEAIEGLDLAWPKPALAPADLAAARKALARD